MPSAAPTVTYRHVKWGWDSGDKFVSVHAPIPGLKKGDKGKVSCDFTTNSFDLTVRDVEGASYRLSKSNLEKDINPEGSKVRVKDGKVVLLLAKVNTWDFWTNLVSKTARKPSKASAAAPDGGIMDMMKEMYESGDDTMKRTIGEAWEKSQRERMMGGAPGGAASGSGLGAGGGDLGF